MAGIQQLSRFSPQTCEHLLNDRDWRLADMRARARLCIDALTAAKVGGECWGPRMRHPTTLSVFHLVVVPEDFYLPSDIGEDEKLTRTVMMMVIAAKAQTARIVLATGSNASRNNQNRLAKFATSKGWTFVGRTANAWDLLEDAKSVCVIDDEIGFLALLKGLEVQCFGRPFYAGWGLTTDHGYARPTARTYCVEELFAAACLLATDYTNPHTAQECGFEDICEILSDWRKINDFNRQLAACVGMSFWKQRRMRDLLRSTDHVPRFYRNPAAAVRVAKKKNGAVAVWAAREPAGLRAKAVAAGVAVINIEDGFVRSVGLGADFMPAASIVMDRAGIYFDPTHASDLDTILENTTFPEQTIDRSRNLIAMLISRGITKYNTGGTMAPVSAPIGSRKLFVPGQVENDRSVSLGGAGIYRNIDLLRRVRELNPDAFIIYKPHPDVEAGHRPGAVAESEILEFANHIVREVSTAAIIPVVDEVHTLTSLAGFEALIRNKLVVVYGKPFYAGWGLTTDIAPVAHRRRRLSIEQLVAGALILYPRYLDPLTKLPCGPETVIDRMALKDIWRAGPLIWLRRFQGDMTRHFRAFRSSIASANR
jgi:capsular polysaccharide export protein